MQQRPSHDRLAGQEVVFTDEAQRLRWPFFPVDVPDLPLDELAQRPADAWFVIAMGYSSSNI